MINPKLEFRGLDTFLKGLGDRKPIVKMGVAAEGAAAAYAHVWEYGNFRQTKKGPRTVMGINPNGERIWMSSQAPLGYIAINVDKYLTVIKSELNKMDFSQNTGAEMLVDLRRTGKKILTQVAEIIEKTAPVDTGQLKSSFRVVDGDEE